MTNVIETTDATRQQARKRWFLVLGVILLAAAIGFAIYHFFLRPASEETDDAYVNGNIVAITAREAGTVIAIHADNTEMVAAGQPLIDLDPATTDVALAAAEARLAGAVRSVRSDISKVHEEEAAVAQARTELAKAQNDFARRRAAASEGAVSGEEVAHADDAVTTARAALNLALSRLAQARTAVQGVDIPRNPEVLSAVAEYRRAAIVSSHMHIKAPVAGVVGQRTVQLGQRVPAGTPLMVVVPMRQLWIDANFRETQLRDLRVGQPATITTDIYGGDVKFHGRVLGLAPGSGNAFALLPPQNASGNWIKIVQRLPVRISLDARELDKHPLRIGLSTVVTVDTGDASGPLIARSATGNVANLADPDIKTEVDAKIATIIAANSGMRRQ